MRALAVFIISSTCSAVAADGTVATQFVRPGIGFFGDPDGSFLEVTQLTFGSRVHVHVPPGGERVERFSVAWGGEGAGWTRFTFDEFRFVGHGESVIWHQFAPLQGPEWGRAGLSVVVPPHPQRSGLGIWTQISDCFQPPCAGDLFVEYSITNIDPPLPGDFDVDDTVDFVDFLTLAKNFEQPSSWVPWSWRDGDANLDEQIDMADFLILAANFGATREPAPVPAPAALSLLAVAICSMGALRRRRPKPTP